MTPETVMTIGQRALEITILLSMPLLLAALVIGLLVGVFQAATLAFAGPWMLKLIVGYTRELFESIPMLVG
jgi:flagellar biosynthetic protein FliQ